MSKTVAIPGGNKAVGGPLKEDIYVSPSEKKDGAMGIISRFLRFDSIGKKTPAADSPTSTEPATTYYGVYIPCEIKKGPDEEALHVYEKKSEAMELVRRYKAARFKAFRSRQEAISFALRGADCHDTADGNDNSLIGEKPYPFKAPSPQDMVALRKAIEAGLASTVRDRVWDNPRYLVSSGHTPAILQEGSRYNALHIAAKAQNAELCNLVLTTVGSPHFVQTLYGQDADPDTCKEFAEILVDRYLNTPDKAMNETPLHFAAKFGAEGVVDVLTSFPQCDKNARNKFGEKAEDIICKRASNASQDLINRISRMLSERFYVPVLHTEDGSEAPTIGCPFTPAHPPEINMDPLSPRYEIRAFAGPMRPQDAETFRRKWKTPPRSLTAKIQPPTFRLKEMSKGLECVGRHLAEEMKVGWKEYWPFLDTFTDLRTTEGLTLLENYLKAKYEAACSSVYNDSCVMALGSPGDHSPSPSIGAPSLASTPARDNTLSPMSELCVAMKTCRITDRSSHWRKTDPLRQRLCRQPGAPNGGHTVSQLVCIERTCQVFAKRIADALTFSLGGDVESASDSLKAEARHLQHTMLTYMDDERFQRIEFGRVHARLAQLAVYRLRSLATPDTAPLHSLLEFLSKLRCPNDDIFSSDDEKKPHNAIPVSSKSSRIDSHVRCLAAAMGEELSEDKGGGPCVAEAECEAAWAGAAACSCDWRADPMERGSKKGSSFRKSWSSLSTSPKGDSFIRRLTFDHDIGDGNTQQAVASRPISVNSPAGDSAPPPDKGGVDTAPADTPTLYTIDVANCQVLTAEISEDESGHESDVSAYETAASDSDDMQDASDAALADAFIYGDHPTKMDRLVFEALSGCEVDPELYPSVCRWRHHVALYPPAEADRWPAAPLADESVAWGSPMRVRVAPSPSPATPARAPHKDTPARSVPLQVSNWLRVTGPHSPRAALQAKQVGHNVSFGF